MGVLEILTIVFVVLKLIGVISWSWWVVLLPELIVLPIYVIALIFYYIQLKKINKLLKDDI